MAVLWEDNYYNNNKIQLAPDSRKRIKHWMDPGLIMGDEIADFTDCESLASIDEYFNVQSIPAQSAIASSPFSFWLSDANVLEVSFQNDPAPIWTTLEHKYLNGGLITGGWKDLRTGIYLYVNQAVRINTQKIYLQMQSKTSNQVQSATTMTIQISDYANNRNFLVDQGTGALVDSGIPIPSTDQWVCIEIEVIDKIGYYHVTSVDAGKQTSNIVRRFEGMWHGVSTILNVIDDGTMGSSYYFDFPKIETHLEQQADEDVFPANQQEFKTTNITDVNWYQWDKIKLSKIGESLSDESFITVSVLDSSNAVITGFENLIDSEIDISSITEDEIILHIKFWAKNSYESPKLEKTVVSYFASGGEVSLAVTANTYNDDITTPVTTKTGFRITLEATAEEPTDIDEVVDAYWFDFGDGLNSGWQSNNVVNKVYNKHSQNISEAGADQEWNARVKIRYRNESTGETNVSSWSNIIDMNVLNSAPVARVWPKPVVVRMSGAGPSASVTLFGNSSFDQDDNGQIRQSGGYKFDLGDGTPETWQDNNYVTNVYTVVGTYVVGLTVRDDLDTESTKLTTRIKILSALTATIIVFDREPTQADISLDAELQVTPSIAGGYPNVEPTSLVTKVLKIIGNAHLQETDITLMEGYVVNNTLVSFKYYDLDIVLQSFTGYIKSFRLTRRGGFKDDVPWSATIQFKEV